jgi:hypothetical protein
MLLFRLLTTGLCVVCVVLLATIQPARLCRMDRVRSHMRQAVTLAPADGSRSAEEPGSGSPCRDSPRRNGGASGALPPVSVVDVASGVAPASLAGLVHLGPGERVSAIDDRAVDSDLEAGAWIASLAPHAGEFLDLTVSSETTERRVLVLMH